VSTSKLQLCAFFISVLFISACGGGDSGNNDSQNNLNGVPRPITDDGSNSPSGTAPTDPTPTDSPPTPASPNTPANNPDAPENPNTQTPNTPATPETPQTPQTPATQTPEQPETPEAPQAPSGGPAPADLSNLIGNVRFEYSFSNSSDVFTLDKVFTEATRSTDAQSGTPILELGAGTTVVTRCAILPNARPYFCFEVMGTSPTTAEIRLFLFDLDSARTGSGNFEFCPAGTDINQCVVSVIATPDGTVNVSVNASNAATPSLLGINQQLITVDVSAHQLVAKQAQASGGNATTASQVNIPLATEFVRRAVAEALQ